MFEPVSSRLNINLLEEEILRFWKQNDVFHQSMTSREGGPEYVFFEARRLPMANRVCIMFWRGCSRICSRAIRA